MIARIDIVGLNLSLDSDIKRYISKHIGKLDKYLPRAAKKNVHVEVKLLRSKANSGDVYECEIIMHLPDRRLVAKESTVNMYAASDIAERKLRNQIIRYKQEHIAHLRTQKRGILKRVKTFLASPEG